MEDNNIYEKIVSPNNLILAYKKARKGKTKREYVKEFEKNLLPNLRILHDELVNQTYHPKQLKTFILRDPKTRKISKSSFRDRIVHHAIIRVIEPIFEKMFIYDSCANRRGKGTLFALKRFERFQGKVTDNLSKEAFCLKADIKHYFQEIDRKILLNIISKRIKDEKTLHLIKLILNNFDNENGMPLGNLTSQFFANVYLNELDRFVKHQLKGRYYIRYVDDFIILHKYKPKLAGWKKDIEIFLKEQLKIELHPEKSKIIHLSRGIDFVGFRIFYHFKLLRKRNIRKIKDKILRFNEGKISKEKFIEISQGWNAYAKWANGYNLKKRLFRIIQFHFL